MKNIVGLVVMFFLGSTLLAQKGEDILMTIGGDPVSIGEFENIYNKNR